MWYDYVNKPPCSPFNTTKFDEQPIKVLWPFLNRRAPVLSRGIVRCYLKFCFHMNLVKSEC